MADPLKAPEKPATPPEAIGHVAPSFEAPKHFNTLVIRPEYRISLRLGDFEELFNEGPTKNLGRAARLQVLGLFYFPLNHKKRKAAFKVGWEHYKTEILKQPKNADADQDIQTRLQEWIVQGGQLPPPAEDPTKPKPENFAKIRFPGAYTFLNGGGGVDLNNDPKYPFIMGSGIDEMEALYRRDNPVLHKIPLVALVEKKDPESGEWKPAPHAMVYFQLVPPYELPPFQDGTAANDQFNRPPLRNSSIGGSFPGDPAQQANAGAGSQKYAEAKDPGIPTGAAGIAAKPHINDNPQAYNCPKDHGGKNGIGKLDDGTDVDDVIFATKSTKGFNTKGARTKHPPYPVAEKVTPSGDKHKHAVKAKANDEGEAGVIFTPSSCGGDLYRIRAYVGPDTLKGPGSDGTGAAAVCVNTGTFVIWRHLRISQYVRHDAGGPANELLDPVYGAHSVAEQNTYLTGCYVVDTAAPPVNQGLAPMDCASTAKPVAANVGQLNGQFDRVVSQFAKAFCEVEGPPETPHTLTDDEWTKARAQALADMEKGMKKLNLKLDLRKLFHFDTAAITRSNAVTHLPMREPTEYSNLFSVTSKKRMAPAGFARNTPAWIEQLFWDYGVKGFLRAITRNGYLPGLTVIQGAFGCAWQILVDGAGNTLISGYSGMAMEYRGAFVWCGSVAYPRIILVPPNKEAGWTDAWQSYDYTSNCCHEMGHCLSRVHAPGNNPGGTPGGVPAGFSGPNLHDPLADSICVMAYKACEGQFCAKCLFAFRGWSLKNLTDV